MSLKDALKDLPYSQMIIRICHTVDTTLFHSVICSMIQMAECDIFLYVFTRKGIKGDSVE
jgi:hypothetical protein